MQPLLFKKEHIAEHYDFLNTCGFLGYKETGETRGYLRAAYSDAETAAMMHFHDWAVAKGAVAEWDHARNLCLTWNPTADQFIEYCSHVDTVPGGGNYDGVAGIVAEVLAAEKLIKEGMLPKKFGVKVRIFRGEESGTFGVAYIGSKSLKGVFDPLHLDKQFGAMRLRDAMISQGADIDKIVAGVRTLSDAENDAVIERRELHIEQGPVLLNEPDQPIDIGIVTSIRGARRLEVVLHGKSAHSGTTPLAYRRDANVMAARVILMAETFLERELRSDDEPDLIITPSLMKGGTGYSSVSGVATLGFDIRGTNKAYLDDVTSRLSLGITELLHLQSTKIEFQEVSRTEPVEALDTLIQAAVLDVVEDAGMTSLELPSGAGHDLAELATLSRSDGSSIPSGMIFIPTISDSHSPDEQIPDGSLEKGAHILTLSSALFAESVLY